MRWYNAVFKCARFHLWPLDGPYISVEEPNVFDKPMQPADSRNTRGESWDLDWCFSLKLAASLKTICFVWEDQFFEDQPNWDTLMVTGRACSFQPPESQPRPIKPSNIGGSAYDQKNDQETSNFLGSFNIFNQVFSTSPKISLLPFSFAHVFHFFPMLSIHRQHSGPQLFAARGGDALDGSLAVDGRSALRSSPWGRPWKDDSIWQLDRWVCLKIMYPYTQWFCWSLIPTKWLFHWGYTPFSDIPI